MQALSEDTAGLKSRVVKKTLLSPSFLSFILSGAAGNRTSQVPRSLFLRLSLRLTFTPSSPKISDVLVLVVSLQDLGLVLYHTLFFLNDHRLIPLI